MLRYSRVKPLIKIMNQKTLLKISLIISITGILFLLLLSNLTEAKKLDIKEITNKIIDKKVEINGKITNIKNYDNMKIIKVKDKTGEINLILYTDNKLNLTINQTINVIGIVKRYKQELEIQADRIVF